MTNLDYIKQASVEDIAIELVCNPFKSAVAAKEWLLKERIVKPKLSFEQILRLKFFSNDLYKTLTVREFLKTILSKFVLEREDFSSKRPFGNSDWDSDLIQLFINNQIISGTIKNSGPKSCIESWDEKQFNLILQELIKEL